MKKYQECSDAIDDFDEKPLNVSAKINKQPQQAKIDPKIQEEYEKFMKQMNLQQGDDSGDMANFAHLMGNLLNNISGTMAEENMNQPNQPQDEEIKKKMEEMFKNLDGGNFEDVANKLLNQFMDKDILLEPLLETQKMYKEALDKEVPVADRQRYLKQQKIVDELIVCLEKDPNNKDVLIEKFEKLQEYGAPPPGIETGFGMK